ncbi:MAG: ABC transporter ATP-binding protein [Anaerolineales bacterium]|nr:ABC transporter ATP-binding protein [Anaerolineales bacterium]
MSCVVEIRDLSFSYPDGHLALHGINLQIGHGDRVAMVGPNGAGKSTLLLQLNGILQGEGQISIGDLPLNKQNLGRIRAMVGLVFQSPDDQLFSPTVFEDVAYGPIYQGLDRDQIQQRVDSALKAVGMLDYKDRVSYHLSTGEKKRIAIASVLSMEPQILVMDEPTAGLDPRARRQLIQLLQELPISMLIASHDLAMVQELCPRMVVMDGGQIVGDDSTDRLLENETFLYEHGLEPLPRRIQRPEELA